MTTGNTRGDHHRILLASPAAAAAAAAAEGQGCTLDMGDSRPLARQQGWPAYPEEVPWPKAEVVARAAVEAAGQKRIPHRPVRP